MCENCFFFLGQVIGFALIFLFCFDLLFLAIGLICCRFSRSHKVGIYFLHLSGLCSFKFILKRCQYRYCGSRACMQCPMRTVHAYCSDRLKNDV